MTLWLLAVIPTAFPRSHQRADHARAGVGLARSRRPWTGKTLWSRCERDPHGGRQASPRPRLAVLARRSRGAIAIRRSRAARWSPVAFHPVVGDVFADAA